MKTHNPFFPTIFAAVLLVAICGSLPTVRAQDNSWTSAGSGFWTNASSWSLGAAPSNNPNVNITSAGNKTVTIDAGTPASSLTITNLNIYGSDTNTLFLSGNSTPLNVLGLLDLGYGYPVFGALVVDGGGQLVTTNSGFRLGQYGVGTLTVSNGTWLASGGNVGSYGSLSRGTLNIAGGTSLISGNLIIGNDSLAGQTGIVLMTGGQLVTTNSAGSSITGVGYYGTGIMTVSNGTWQANQVYVGVRGGSQGTLSIAGGTNLISGILSVGDFAAGVGTGSVLLTGGQLVTTNSSGAYVGDAGVGTMTVSNGTWLAQTVTVGNNAGGRGILNIAGGTNLLLGGLTVGNAAGSTGSVLIAGSGLLELQSSITLGSGQAALTNRDGGTLRFTGQNNPTIARGGGSLVVTNAIVEFKNASAANVLGGITNITVQADSTLSLNSSTNASVAGYTIDNAGTGNYAQLALTGSNPLWQSTVLNVGAGGSLLVTNAVGAWVSAALTNQGNFRVIGSRVTYGGPVVIGGSYVSDPSTNTFTSNVTVTASGSLHGSNGDLFVFYSGFINQSTNRAQFDLSRSAVFFTNGAGVSAHTLNLTNSLALDMGAVGMNAAQLATNFSLGTLSISLSNNVTLTGVKSGATTNALYVGWLDLSAWNTNAGSLNSTLLAALTLPDINLYYDAGDARNAYLQDASYALWGGGGLLIPIPEPSTLALLLLGPSWILVRRRLRGA